MPVIRAAVPADEQQVAPLAAALAQSFPFSPAAFGAWAASRGCALVALATRRAAPFHRALGYEESAVCFRKLLTRPPPAG